MPSVDVVLEKPTESITSGLIVAPKIFLSSLSISSVGIESNFYPLNTLKASLSPLTSVDTEKISLFRLLVDPLPQIA